MSSSLSLMLHVELLLLCIPPNKIRKDLEERCECCYGKHKNEWEEICATKGIRKVHDEAEPYAGAPRTTKKIVNGAEEGSGTCWCEPITKECGYVVVGKETHQTEGRKCHEYEIKYRDIGYKLSVSCEETEACNEQQNKEEREENVPEGFHMSKAYHLYARSLSCTVDVMKDEDHLIRDKYNGDTSVDLKDDIARLASGEPLAYVIGWIPFLDLRISLASKPLIPRPETEWWTERLIQHLSERFGSEPFSFLDLCAGSGAIGLSVLKAFPNAEVSFGEIVPEHTEQIRRTLSKNGLDASRAHIKTSDLFAAFSGKRFSVIATNPPYIPSERVLDASVTDFEPANALFAGTDGLEVIRSITKEAPEHLLPEGELWIETDIDNNAETAELLRAHGANDTQMHTDIYGRPRIVVGYYA